MEPFEIFQWYLVGLYNRSIWSVTCKNDNSACLHFLIMSPDPYFYFVCFLCMVGNSATFYNILILLSSNIEKANMECYLQESQLCCSLFSCYVTWFIF